MSLTKKQKEAVEHMIRVGHQSYKCIAATLNVPIGEVRKIGAPIATERWNNVKALNKLVEEAEYDRRPYEDNAVIRRKRPMLGVVIGYVLIACLMAVIIAAAIGLIRLFLGL